MENFASHQEILLVTTSTFLQREWCEKETYHTQRQLSFQEALENACWNGVLAELLPETLVKSSTGKRLILWNIRQGKGSLHLQLSEFPLDMEDHYSINSVHFIRT